MQGTRFPGFCHAEEFVEPSGQGGRATEKTLVKLQIKHGKPNPILRAVFFIVFGKAVPVDIIFGLYFDRDNLFVNLDRLGVGSAIFSPLAQGLLTNKYISGEVPVNSRAHENVYLKESVITAGLIARLEELRKIASARGQSLSQMALSFVLAQRSVSTVLIGARNTEQLMENLRTLETDIRISDDEMREILSYA